MGEKREKNKIDMLQGPMAGKILLFALPVAGSGILQQLFNSADVAVAGRFAGDAALAAVGGNTPVINFFLNLFLGISLGANALIARYIGQGERERIRKAVHSAMALAGICGILMMIVGTVLSVPVLRLMNTPPDVMDGAVLYMKIYFAGAPFIIIYNFGAAILRSVGDTRRPLIILAVTGAINVCLNLVMVVCFHMGVAGVALATLIANVISCISVVVLLIRETSDIRLLPKKIRLDRESTGEMIRIGFPAGLQGAIFSLSNIMIQSGINSFGTASEAGSAAAVNFEFFTYFVTSSFCQATMTFVSQNYGAGKMERCRRAAGLSLVFGISMAAAMSLVFVLFRDFFLGLYTTGSESMEYGVIRMIHVELLACIICLYEIPSGAMRGMGRSMLPAVITVFGVCVMRVIWMKTAFAYHHTYATLMDVYPFTWIVTILLMLPAYFAVRKQAEREVIEKQKGETI